MKNSDCHNNHDAPKDNMAYGGLSPVQELGFSYKRRVRGLNIRTPYEKEIGWQSVLPAVIIKSLTKGMS